MRDNIDVQIATDATLPVNVEQIRDWALGVLKFMDKEAELTIRLVDEVEMTELNYQYRKINKSTNVLAFPANVPEMIQLEVPLIGDVIICPEVLKKKAQSYEKPLADHWAHILTHGILHLLGYDHIKESDEKVMHEYEIKILKNFAIDNPYEH